MEKEKKYCYEYPRPAVAADCLVISEENNKKEILLIKRKHDPFKDKWALPGGFMEIDETAEQAAARELEEETGVKIEPRHFIPVSVFSAVNRDPRTRLISLSYLTHIKKSEVTANAGDDASEAEWHDLNYLPEMAFDHKDIIQSARDKKLIS